MIAAAASGCSGFESRQGGEWSVVISVPGYEESFLPGCYPSPEIAKRATEA